MKELCGFNEKEVNLLLVKVCQKVFGTNDNDKGNNKEDHMTDDEKRLSSSSSLSLNAKQPRSP